MSVNQESLTNSGLVGADNDAPDLEYVEVRQDSLTMFGAALGGAILGMLLTLLVLAILNGGTLRYVGGASRLAQMETAYNQLSANVGTNTTNIDTLDANMGQQVQMLEDKIGQQNSDLAEANTVIADLNVSRGQFDTLVDALSGAVNSIKGVEPAVEDASGAAAMEESVDASADDASASLGESALNVLFFADANGNQEQDAGEENLVGISVALMNADGESVAVMESGDGGMSFEGVAAGEYTLVVEDAGDYPLASDELGTVTIEEGADQTVFIAVGSE